MPARLDPDADTWALPVPRDGLSAPSVEDDAPMVPVVTPDEMAALLG
jgi:hypothetical protein